MVVVDGSVGLPKLLRPFFSRAAGHPFAGVLVWGIVKEGLVLEKAQEVVV